MNIPKHHADNLLHFAIATNYEIYDPDQHGGTWLFTIVPTAATISDFISAAEQFWNEKTLHNHGKISGLPYVSFASTQASHRGQRNKISIIDLGDIRIAIPGCDLAKYA